MNIPNSVPTVERQSEEGRAGATPTVIGDTEATKDLFELPTGIYLFCHAVGPLTRAAREATQRYLDDWATEGCDAWDPWLAAVDGFRGELAALLGGTPEQYSPQVNLSSALTKIISSLPRQPGRNRILYSALDFPTIGYVAEAAAKLGYVVEAVDVGEPLMAPGAGGMNASPTKAGEAGFAPTQEDPRLGAIGDDVALVLWTYGYPNTGLCAPPPTREQLRGALLCVDIAQSAGAVPIDVTAWDADFVIGSSVKWLCGGPGAGFLWVRPGLIEQLEPVDVGWFSKSNPFEMDIRLFDYAPDARRFWGGTPSVQPYAAAAASIATIRSIGIDNIRAHSLRLGQRLIDTALDAGVQVVSPLKPELRGGTVVLNFADNSAMLARLREAGVRCDQRTFGLRISPHCYNTEAEIEQVCALLTRV